MFVSQPVVSPPLVLEQAGGLWYEFFELNLNNAAAVWGAEAILVGVWGWDTLCISIFCPHLASLIYG